MSKDTGGPAFPLKEPLTSDSEGMTTENLESVLTVGDTLASRFKARDDIESDLTKQRDELLAALVSLARQCEACAAYPCKCE